MHPTGAPKYIKKILEDFKKDSDGNTLILGNFNTPLSTMARSSKQNINTDIVALNNALDQMDLNAPIKRHRIAEWIRKHDLHICCLQQTHLRTEDLNRLKVKGFKQIFQENGQEKKAGVAILISGNIDFQKRTIKRETEGKYIILKR